MRRGASVTILRRSGMSWLTGRRPSAEGDIMKKFLVAICSIVLSFGLAGCWGKAPLGKGKAPVVQTRG